MTQSVERLSEDERWKYITRQSMFFSVGNMTGSRIDPQAVVDFVRSAVSLYIFKVNSLLFFINLFHFKF